MDPVRSRLLCALFLLSALSLEAATVAVQVVESGPYIDSEALEASSAWEYGVLDALFDAGHIVCNAPMLRLDPGTETASDYLADPLRGVVEARNGGADVLIIVLLEYGAATTGQAKTSPVSVGPSRRSPNSATIRTIKLNAPGVFAQERNNGLSQSRSGLEDQKNAAALMRTIISRLKER